MDGAVKGYPYCKAAIDAALYDVVGKALNTPAYQLLGGLFRERIPIAHSLGLMEIGKAVDEARQATAEGVKTIKLKGGVEPQRDIALVERIRAAVGPDTKICVDANQGYPTPKLAVQVIRAMAEFDLLYMEQPVEGIDRMAEVARRVDTPVMADESAWTPQDVLEIARKNAADVISIYTTKPGGLFKAQASRRRRSGGGLALQCERLGGDRHRQRGEHSLGGFDRSGDLWLRRAGFDAQGKLQEGYRGYLLLRRYRNRSFRVPRREYFGFVKIRARH